MHSFAESITAMGILNLQFPNNERIKNGGLAPFYDKKREKRPYV